MRNKFPFISYLMKNIAVVFLLLIPGISKSQNLSFDGTNDYVSTANTSETDYISKQFQ